MIQVVERTFAVLEYISRDPQARNRLSDIAEKTGLNASTCARILKTLIHLGYVAKHLQGGGYSLGHKAYLLADKSTFRYDLVLASRTFMAQFVRKLNESILLATLYHGSRVVLYEIEAEQLIQAQRETEEECENPLCTATGRLMLAYLPEEECDKLISSSRNVGKLWPRFKKKSEIHKALEEIREKGWTVNRTDFGVVGVAVPVREDDEVVAALGVYLPAFRFTPEHEQEILDEMNATVAKIEKVLLNKKKSQSPDLDHDEQTALIA